MWLFFLFCLFVQNSSLLLVFFSYSSDQDSLASLGCVYKLLALSLTALLYCLGFRLICIHELDILLLAESCRTWYIYRCFGCKRHSQMVLQPTRPRWLVSHQWTSLPWPERFARKANYNIPITTYSKPLSVVQNRYPLFKSDKAYVARHVSPVNF